MPPIKFTVIGKVWKLKVLSKKEYFSKKWRHNSVATTRTDKRCIYLSPRGKDKETLMHELIHAYIYELCLGSTNNIDPDDKEEIFAELMSKFGRKVLDLSDRIHKAIRCR